MSIKYFLLAIISLALVTSCKNTKKNDEKSDADKAQKDSAATASENVEKTVYLAQLSSLNAEVTGTETSGTAKFVVANGTMTVTIDIKGAPANMKHWQHFHGFKDGSDAHCATAADDANGDGIIDVVETEKASGTTMVPFNKIPTAMKVGAATYPKADDKGNYHYQVEIPMEKLKSSFAKTFGDSGIQLDKRVLYIHGVQEDKALPESVASIADIPAQVTIPIACGEIVKQ